MAGAIIPVSRANPMLKIVASSSASSSAAAASSSLKMSSFSTAAITVGVGVGSTASHHRASVGGQPTVTHPSTAAATVYMFQSLLLTSSHELDRVADSNNAATEISFINNSNNQSHSFYYRHAAANLNSGNNYTAYYRLPHHYYKGNSSSNDDDGGMPFTLGERIFFSLALVAMIVVGLIGNGLTITALLQRRFRLRTPANFFVLNLAIADFSISVLSNTTHLANIWAGFMQHNLAVCRFLATLCLLACAESLFTLTAIAVFRFLGVRNSLQGLKRRRRLALMLIAITWLMSMSFSLGNVFAETDGLWTPDAMTCLYKFRETAMALLTLFLVVACLLLIAATYFSLIVRLVNNENEQKRCFSSDELISPNSPSDVIKKNRSLSFGQQQMMASMMAANNNNNNNEHQDPAMFAAGGAGPFFSSSKRRLLSIVSTSSFPLVNLPKTSGTYNRLNMSKTVKTVIFLVVLVYIFWIPTFVIQGLSRYQVVIPHQVSMFALLLGHANSSVNFVIYAVFNKLFRGALVEFLCSIAPCCSKFFNRPVPSANVAGALMAKGKPPPLVIEIHRNINNYYNNKDINNINNNSPPRFFIGTSPEMRRVGGGMQPGAVAAGRLHRPHQSRIEEDEFCGDIIADKNNCDPLIISNSNRRNNLAYSSINGGGARRKS